MFIREQARERLRALASSRRPNPSALRGADGKSAFKSRETRRGDVPEEKMEATPRPRGELGTRERRMFAGLVGTLRQSKSNLEEKEREVLEKRKAIEAAVTGKSEEIRRELRETQYKEFLEKRDAEEKKKFEVDLKYKETERALIEAEYEEMKAAVRDGGLLTKTEPILVYKRARRSADDDAACQESEERLELWLKSQLERVDNAIRVIHKKREETIERRAKAMARGEDHEDVDVEDAVEELQDFDEAMIET
jgi:hypothetical protein